MTSKAASGHHGRKIRLPDFILFLGLLKLTLTLVVGELVTPALADFLDHCPKVRKTNISDIEILKRADCRFEQPLSRRQQRRPVLIV